MATYYVDFVGGDDTDLGTSEGEAWQHCPGDANATDNADITFADGDTVYFKKGVTYEGKITTNQNNVTYTITSWGTGDAVHDGTGETRCFVISHDDITISGVDSNRNYKFTGAPTSNAIQASYANTDGVKIEYIKVVDITADDVDGIKLGGSTYAHTNFEIANCYCENITGFGIKISGQGGSGNGSIHDCEVTNCGASVSPRSVQINISDTQGVGITNVSVYNNTVHTAADATFTGGIGFQDATGYCYDNTIYGNYRGLSYNPSSTPALVGTLRIHRNKVYDNNYYGIDINGTDSDAYGIVYNNLFYNNCQTTAGSEIRIQNTGTYNKIYNNTIYNSGSNASGIYISNSSGNCTVKNNIIQIQGAADKYPLMDYTGTIAEDYNLMDWGHGVWYIYWNSTGYATMAAYRSASSQGAHSIDVAATFLNAPTDLKLSVGSRGIDEGVNLSGEGFSTDYDGNHRPSGYWDIGAYEYGSGKKFAFILK